jgi:phosphopantetheinyl transferase
MEAALDRDAEVLLLELSQIETADEQESLDLLSEAERERARSFRSSLRRRQFVRARAAVRLKLGHRLGIDPAEVRLVNGVHGRPEVSGQDFWFGVSHDEHLVVVAFRRGGAVGTDIQRLNAARPWGRLLERICGAAELAEARAEAREIAHRAFFERWVAKEALLKALGCGLSVPPAQVRLDRRLDGSFGVLGLRSYPEVAGSCEIRELGGLPAGFCGAVAELGVSSQRTRIACVQSGELQPAGGG